MLLQTVYSSSLPLFKNQIVLSLLSVICFLNIASCSQSEGQAESGSVEYREAPVMEVTAVDFAFQAPDTISSGWTTLRLANEQGMEIHELGLAKLPDGKDINDYMNEIMPAWESALLQLQNGDIESSEIGEVAYGMLPEWNSEIRYVKSRGLVSAGRETENIMFLEPGTYMIECWVKNAEGKIHISNGMIRQLTVTKEDNGASVPEFDYQISLTKNAIVTSEPLTSGKHTISVDFELDEDEQIIHGDVHLLRLEDDTNLARVANWMGWYTIGGLKAPAPAEFLGGIDTYGSLPYGEKAYFSVDVEPGNYAWIVNAPADEQLWEEFTVE